jgi:hypothetical protein
MTRRDHLRERGSDGRIALLCVRASGGFGSVQEPLVDSYEKDNDHLDSIKGDNFIDQLRK